MKKKPFTYKDHEVCGEALKEIRRVLMRENGKIYRSYNKTSKIYTTAKRTLHYLDEMRNQLDNEIGTSCPLPEDVPVQNVNRVYYGDC